MNISKFGLCTALALSFLGLNACSSDSSSPNEANSEVSGNEQGSDEAKSSSSGLIENDDKSSSSEKQSDAKSSSSVKANSSSSAGGEASSSSKKKDDDVVKEWPNLLGTRGGFYASDIKIDPPKMDDGLTLSCTTDGSVPTSGGSQFTEALTISKNTVVRCVSFKNGAPVDTATETFFIGENVNMPVVAVSVSPQFFANNYVYSRSCEGSNPKSCPAGLTEEIEYPVHVEYFEKGSSSTEKAWEINAGISLMGQWSRTYAKKSVSISMRSEYQDGRLKYPLFATRPEIKKFKAFNLRNNGNRFVHDYFEDPMATSLLEGSGVDYQRSRQVVVFYNGEYYGIHDMREKLNEHFVETNYGIDSKTVDIVKHVDETITASGGTTTDYESMLQFIYDSDFSGSGNANYEKLKSMMDVGNYADYMAAQIYYRNGDWPNNNVRAWKSPTQPWKFMVFDLDHGFGWEWSVAGFDYYRDAAGKSMFDWIRQGGKGRGMFDTSPTPCSNNASAKCFHTIFVKLMANDDFKRLFANHAAVMYDYYINSKTVTAATTLMANSLDASEVSRDMQKYPRQFGLDFDVSGTSFITWATERDAAIWGEYQEEFSLSDPIKVTIASSGDGTVLLDGMKLPGKSTSTNYTGKFFGGNKMELSAVPSGSAVFSAWEDGSKDNPRLVTPESGAKYVATFK